MSLDDIRIMQMVRFVFWGTLNTALSILVYWILVYFGLNIYIANAVAVLVSVFSGHFFNKRKVFESEENRTLRKYFMLWFVFYLISSFLLYLFVSNGVDKYLAAVLVGAILVPASFIFQKLMIFKT